MKTRQERKDIIARVIRGLRQERHSSDGDAAFVEAQETFTPAQLRYLGRAMREAMSELDERDAEAW